MAKIKLTKRAIDKLPTCSKAGFDLYYDVDLKGFGLKVFPSGRKVFFIEYGRKGHRRRMSLKAYGLTTAEEAREEARKKLNSQSDGIDPLEAKRRKQTMPTYGERARAYVEDVKRRKKRPYHDVYHLVGPRGGHGHKEKQSPAMKRWAGTPLDKITADDVTAWFRSVSKRGPILANRALASLRAFFQDAVDEGILRSNPCVNVKDNSENQPRSRVLTDEEREALLTAIDKLEDDHERALFRLLIDTGCRKGEALGARWEDLDFSDPMKPLWTIPSPKAGIPQSIPLAQRTATMLLALPHWEGNPHVFPGRRKDSHRMEVRTTWEALKSAAGIEDLHLHDLRRDYGLRAAKQAGILVASKLLRHHDVRITAKVYAQLGVEDLRGQAETLANGEGKVLQMPTGKAR